MKSIALFVDVQNVYYTVKQWHRCHFNYRAFWERLSSEGEIVKAFAYAIDRGDRKQQQFQQILRGIGFDVKLKPFIQRSDGSTKGDWDVGITLDVVEYARQVDKVVLVSGDGDFDLLVEKISKEYGVEVDVYGVPALTADSLIKVAISFVPIEADLLL